MALDPLPFVNMRDLRTCVHCGFCLPTCPTYQVLGVEMDSPRGRIMQMEAVKRGEIALDEPALRDHLSLCLACRACETACPSGVPYGRMIEGARASLPSSSRKASALGAFVLRGLFPRPRLLDLFGASIRAYQRSGVQRLVRKVGLPGSLAEMEALLPQAQGPVWQGARATTYWPRGESRMRVALVRGCVMQQFFARTNEATARVLVENGCTVVAPPAPLCCGALHVHAGDRAAAQGLARSMIDAILELKPDLIAINAAGCGSTLKEYGHLLADDPEYAARAAEFSRRVRDINELLAALSLRAPSVALRNRVTYQDACHLAHAQRIREQPRAVLQAIPGLELVELAGSDVCCGSAGIYNLTQPAMSRELLDRKMDAVEASGAEILAVANPGCAIQIGAGIRARGLAMTVVHPVDLLDRAYRAERRLRHGRIRHGG
ncbi:MAG TPA: heterodisulfide reductase-related iron-sulfur binding cluster [Chloroflexota bacterium]|nr:heterodisulfide reductase-related iron-sulfur binding cluster [Chloroflexota bacterium]